MTKKQKSQQCCYEFLKKLIIPKRTGLREEKLKNIANKNEFGMFFVYVCLVLFGLLLDFEVLGGPGRFQVDFPQSSAKSDHRKPKKHTKQQNSRRYV